jgi:hypothetical protein
MTQILRTVALSLALACAFSCGDDDDDKPDAHEQGLQDCCYLGNICHDPAKPEWTECHQIGHEGDADQCTAEFERCKKLCDPDNETTLPESCEHPEDAPPHEEHDEDGGHEEAELDAGEA